MMVTRLFQLIPGVFREEKNQQRVEILSSVPEKTLK